jgi:hypothetical protein
MKTMLALGCLCACALLVGCGNENSAQTIESNQVRPPAAEAVAPPGSTVKLGSNSTGGPGASAPAPKTGK